MTTIMDYKFIIYYFFIGVINTMILDYMVTKVAKLFDKPPFTNLERVVVLLLWPIYALTFWYNFFKSIFKGNK